MIPDTLNTRNIPPQMGGMGTHPPGIHDATITNTYLKETAKGDGAYLTTEFTSPVGRIEHRFNLFNPSAQAVEIANKEISALTHCINIYDIAFPKNPDGTPNMQMAGHNLRNARCKIEVVPQKKKDANGTWVDTGYMEIKKFFDVNGNEPGKQSTAPGVMQQQPNGGGWGNQPQGQPQAQPQPQQTNPNPAPAGWGNPPAQQPAQQAQPQANSAWGNPAAQPQQQPQQNQPNPPQGGNGTPPWAR